jgi:hypothetical protein
VKRWSDCPDCEHRVDWALIVSCASVGIELGKSPGLMLREHLAHFHAHGHQVEPPEAQT